MQFLSFLPSLPDKATGANDANMTVVTKPRYVEPASKRRRRCACGSAEACFACQRCMEQHCVCGRGGALCRESRACNCRVETRCPRCRGCRRPRGAHCRCEQHRELWRALRDDAKAADAATEHSCSCFDEKRVAQILDDARESKQRRGKLQRMRRRAGLASVRSLYSRKVATAAVTVDEFGDSDVELSDVEDDDLDATRESVRMRAAEMEGTTHVLPADWDGNPLSHGRQERLEWSSSQSYQQSISIPSARARRTPMIAGADQETATASIGRALDNAVFEREREDAMPPEDLVDYLIFTASVKASRLPELIGSLDDTAATAMGIVAQEYMKQLVIRSTRDSPFDTKKRSAQAFAYVILNNFNYSVYLSQCGLPDLKELTPEQIQRVTEELAQLVFGEFLAVQPPGGLPSVSSTPLREVLTSSIREVVISEVQTALATSQQGADTPDPHASTSVADLEMLQSVKLSRRSSKLTGTAVYKYEVGANVGDKHHAKITVDGFETRGAAERSIERINSVLEAQDKRINAIEHPKPPPKAEDPVITELYQQLAEQVKKARAKGSGEATQ